MDVIGIICEYNPMHNGHIYHIKKVKEMFPNSIIVLCMSTNFCERGEISVINKWDKTTFALLAGVDLVIELPFVYSSQSADIFSYGAIATLNAVGVNKIVFGSECNDVELLEKLAFYQINNSKFDKSIKEELEKGINYPTALANVLEKKLKVRITTPNDLLGISYLKEIKKNNYNITAYTILRTNNYHDLNLNNEIISSSAIRKLIDNDNDIKKYVPFNIENHVYKEMNYFDLLKYKVISDINNLDRYQTVDEGIQSRIIKNINKAESLSDLVSLIKTKRYTYNKINRMLIHILTSFTKDEVNKCKNISYIRILGFNKNGKNYLKQIKKSCSLPIITGYKNNNYDALNIEYRVNYIYSMIIKDNSLIKREIEKPIILCEVVNKK